MNKEEHIKQILNNLKNQDFDILKYNKTNYFEGVVTVKNNKLGGRNESIKFLDSLETSEKENFLREGKVLGIIKHKYIPRVYDILNHEDIYLYRFEHIEGFTLQEVLDEFKKRNKKIPEQVATQIILKLLSALEYVHNDIKYKNKKVSIIHSDIKPSNIIFSCRCDISNKIDSNFVDLIIKGEVEPHLIDFGIAKFSGEKNNDGTLNYLSPVQAGHEGIIDWKTDLYQLMLVYSEMITGKKPFQGKKRKEIIESKKNKDFSVSIKNNSIKEIIEKYSKRNTNQSESRCITDLKKLNRKQNVSNWFNENKTRLLTVSILIFLIAFSFIGYNTWDYQTQSTNAIVKKIENNPNPTIEELELALEKIQKRGFEKKYLKPLLEGRFRDKNTGEPLYPSYLDPNGEWILVEANDNSAGAFIGMLFQQSDRYPEILPYAIEYAEPLVDIEFKGMNSKSFALGLIPAYEATEDDKYLNKLIEVADTLIIHMGMMKGITQTPDIYHSELFLFLTKVTGDKKYLNAFEKFIANFVKNNIDNNGYVYFLSQVNATRPDGIPLDDDWGNFLVKTSKDVEKVGFMTFKSTYDKELFMNNSGLPSRDFIQTLISVNNMHQITKDDTYNKALIQLNNYYRSRLETDLIDRFFVSHLNNESGIPIDNLATVKALTFFSYYDKNIYKQKLNSLLNSKYINSEKENGILGSSIFIETVTYTHEEEKIKNQTLIRTDQIFLTI